jgi:hypothetical protein
VSDKQTVVVGGFPFVSILALIFITLKLVGTITWSWWWVLSPIWIPIAIVGTIFLFAVIFALLAAIKG